MNVQFQMFYFYQQNVLIVPIFSQCVVLKRFYQFSLKIIPAKDEMIKVSYSESYIHSTEAFSLNNKKFESIHFYILYGGHQERVG